MDRNLQKLFEEWRERFWRDVRKENKSEFDQGRLRELENCIEQLAMYLPEEKK
jgi:hypothetical protein